MERERESLTLYRADHLPASHRCRQTEEISFSNLKELVLQKYSYIFTTNTEQRFM